MKSLNPHWFVLGWWCVGFYFSDAIKYNPKATHQYRASNQFIGTRSGCVLKCQESKKDINLGLIRIPDMTPWSRCLQMCFLQRNNRKALYIKTPFTINPLAFTKWGRVCQKLEDAPLSLSLNLRQAGSSYSIQPPLCKLSSSLTTFVLWEQQRDKQQ